MITAPRDKPCFGEEDTTKHTDSDQMYTASWQYYWEALERCRTTEAMLAERGFPVHPLVRKRARLTRRLLAILNARRRAEARDLLERLADPSAKVEGTGPDLPEPKGNSPSMKSETDDQLLKRAKIVELFYCTREALEHCTRSDHDLFSRGCVLIRRLGPFTLKLFSMSRAISEEWRRHEAQAFLIKTFFTAERCTPAPLANSRKQALRGVLRQFSPKERSVLIQIWQRARSTDF
jgi:hypothetical protein